MSVLSLPREEFENAKTARGIARLLSPGPTFGLHSSFLSERGKVEQYIFDQFRANYGASVREFMPMLFTTACKGDYTAAVGIRPALGHDLFLEQYLPGSAEQVLGGLTGERVEREQIVEIGSLVASHGGASQLVYLIMAAVLQRAGFKWLTITVTPQVQKAISRLGFELYPLANADPAALSADSLSDWGSYYDCQPQIVAGNLSEAMTVLAGRKVYSRLISHYQDRIETLAIMIKQGKLSDSQHSFAA